MAKKKVQTKSKGLGDTIEKVTKATGVKRVVDKIAEVLDFDCGCDERKEILNRLFPYKVECLTEQEYNYLKEFNFDINTLNSNHKNNLLAVYNRVFNKKRKMTNCVSCWKEIIGDLQKIYNEYSIKDTN